MAKLTGGKAEGHSPKEFDKKQLKEGQKHEKEHTDEPKVAEQIAMDHLIEDKDYYKKLKKMEAGHLDHPQVKSK